MLKENGLEEEEAKTLLEKYGKNEIEEVNKISVFEILLRQIKGNFMIYLLLAAFIISFIVEKMVTAYIILAVIAIVIIVGFIQEYKAEKAINALRKMIMPTTIVIRGGREKEIYSNEIVPGDVLVLRNGERIPADCVILGEKSLLVDESVLTGESREIKKSAAKNSEKYSDENTLLMGSYIISGKCMVKVLKTGMSTQFGKIASMISKAEKDLPLRGKVNKISKYMALVAVIVAVLTGLITLAQTYPVSKENVIEILILVIAISVSAVPEGMPVALMSTLSIGAYRMAKKNAIVNRISIIETLGETTVICSDKTGTITKGEMTVKKILTGQREYDVSGVGYEGNGKFTLNSQNVDLAKQENLSLILKASTICNDAIISRTGDDMIFKPIGTSTEAALLIAAVKAGIFKEDLKFSIEEEIPFSSERKIMSVLAKEGKEKTVYVKGALEIILSKCTQIKKEDGIYKLLEKEKARILENNHRLTSNTYRTLGIAYKKNSFLKMEEELIFLGIIALEDPPREEIKNALAICVRAGISVKMITGDNKETAISIARQIGLEYKRVFTGQEIDEISDENLAKIIKDITIFARVKPEHKLRIVKILKQNGEIVTMTGDGVNDAPALKEAHIGVAMGKNGTDVSRSVADLTLRDDNFATIVDAIKEGRTIFYNIRKFVSYQLSCNHAELAILFFGVLLAPLIGWPIPLLLALHILFMNLVTDNLPSLTLGLNPSSDDIMEGRGLKNSNLLNSKLYMLIAFSGLIMCLLTLSVFFLTYSVLHQPLDYARTTALATLIIVEVAGAFNFRSFRKGVLTRSPLVNKYLAYASAVSILATLVIIYTPVSSLFATAPIGINDWIIVLSAAFVFFALFDTLKHFNNKKHFWNENAD
ncbi:MAG: cation-transporting P-type ATPase [Nanoarchaeota archaeon]